MPPNKNVAAPAKEAALIILHKHSTVTPHCISTRDAECNDNWQRLDDVVRPIMARLQRQRAENGLREVVVAAPELEGGKR